MGMAHNGDTEVDRALEIVVAEINGLTEGQDGGPAVVLTVGGLVIGGTIIPDWQWFDEVEHAARAAFTVHSGGSIDDESGGWARLFRGVSESLVRERDEHRAARNAVGGLADRLPAPARPRGPHQLHPPERCPGPCSRRWLAVHRRDALEGTALRGIGVVLRASW